MKNLKKIALIFAMVMCLAICVFAVNASAESTDNYLYTITDGRVTITKGIYSALSGDVVIPDTIEGCPVTALNPYSFVGCENITSVTVPETVTKIGEGAFSYCKDLKTATLPESITEIPVALFNTCPALETVTIPETVTSIGANAFTYCSALKDITFSDNVTSIGTAAFYKCTSLTSVVIPDSVTTMGASVFAACSGIETAVIGNGLDKLDNGEFYDCSALKSVVIGDSVTSIGMKEFNNCTSLESVIIGDSVTSIGFCAFDNCPKLENVCCNCSRSDVSNITFDQYNDTVSDTTQWKVSHSPAEAVKENLVPATCSAAGSYDSVVYCTRCSEKLSSETATLDIDSNAHVDADDNGICDLCKADLNPDDDNESTCHWCSMVKNSTSALKVFYKVIDVIHHFFEKYLALFDYVK